MPLVRQAKITKRLASCLSWWAILNWVRGHRDEARKLYTESLALAKSFNDDQLTATVTGNLAELTFTEGDIEKAIALAQDSLKIRKTSKNNVGTANVLTNLTAYYLAVDRLDEAKETARDAMRFGRDAQATSLLAYCIQHFALIAVLQKQAHRAAQLLGYVDEVVRKSQFQREPTEQWSLERLTGELKAQLREDEIAALRDEGKSWAEDQAVAEALSI